MNKVYIADDDKYILDLLEIFLQNEGYDVYKFLTGDLLLEHFGKEPADVVILDIMMPGRDGFAICKALRQFSDVPIIFLTAKDTDMDYVVGLSMGSDDYLMKPFNPARLGAKIKSLLRRRSNQVKKIIAHGNLLYKVQEHLILIEGKDLELTKIEFRCFAYLLEHFGEIVAREDLLTAVWGFEEDLETTRVIDETVRRIRKKLNALSSSIVIRNKWGYGYFLQNQSEII